MASDEARETADPDSLSSYILDTFEGVEATTADGITYFFYDPARKFPFATLVRRDDDWDHVSNLDREGVYRLNIGVSRDSYRALLGPHPSRPGPSGVVDTGHDFTALDTFLPHPTYAPLSWISVLNPAERTLEEVRRLLAEAYALDVAKHRQHR